MVHYGLLVKAENDCRDVGRPSNCNALHIINIIAVILFSCLVNDEIITLCRLSENMMSIVDLIECRKFYQQ